MGIEQFTDLKNSYLKIDEIFEEDNIKGEVIEKKSVHQFDKEILPTFTKAETAYKQGSVDSAWIRCGDICYRIVRID